jgi:SWI/SNF-related matrix-associated actin-dependent regulator of chromatin subfamily A member 5
MLYFTAENAAIQEDDAVYNVPASVSRKEIEKQLAKEQRELKAARLARLAQLRADAAAKKAATADMDAQSKLEYLLKSAELFTHFVSPSTDKETSENKKKEGRPKGKHAMSDNEEKDEIQEEGGSSARPAAVRLTKQPSNIAFGQMREYQLEGLNWLINLHDNNISGILADEMGLGKTLQSISLLAYLRESRNVQGPHLVLSPKSTIGNWAKEFQRWCPSLKVLKLQAADKEERLHMVKEELMSGKYDVIVTSFETLCIEHVAFNKFAWYYVIIDEAHRIKNENSVLAKRVRQVESQYRLLLTGTPLQNNLHELWALLNFLLPDIFSSSEDFDSWFSGGASKSDQATANATGLKDQDVVRKLHALLRPFLLRRLKVDVEKALPPKTETKLFIGMSQLQKDLYKATLMKDATALNQIGGPDMSRLKNLLMQMRKVCNHPYLFDGIEPGPPYIDGPHIWESAGKMVLLEKLLPKLLQQNSRALIFTQMTRILDILEDFCRFKGYKYCRIDGNTPGEDRDRQMDEYNAPNSDKFIFMLSTRAGGLGINLYTADTVILYDSDWNPQADLQAMDRAHRIGQKKPVRVLRFITEGTVEEKIIERAERKLFLDAVVIQQGRLANAAQTLSKGELMSMVKFGADEIFKSSGSDGSTNNITDADIDVLLAKGEERTKADSEKLKRDMAHTLSSFDNLLDFSGKEEASLLYNPETAAEISAVDKGMTPIGSLVPMGARERKKIYYDEKKILGVKVRKGTGRGVVRAPVMYDWQFYEKAQIEAYVDKENQFVIQRRLINNRIKVS